MMKGSLKALLSQVIDYAGLFPPARLSLDEAFANYLRYRGENGSWMLGRFICPATKLAALSELIDRHQVSEKLSLSVLGRGGETVVEFQQHVEEDREDIDTFVARHTDGVAVEVFEVRLPAEVWKNGNEGSIRDIVRSVGDSLSFNVLQCYEIALQDDWRQAIAMTVRGLRGYNAAFKLRCGGLKPEAFPSTEQVAHAIITCRDARVPMKFTAGLHHPIRHFDESVQTHMHGFLNVFVAGVLAWQHTLSEAPVKEMLEEEKIDSFPFDETSLRWRGYAADVAAIEQARRSLVTSFGSCSFDEPRADLLGLHLLDAAS
ncbi:MAG: hypothetical protein KatS3mg105_4849 [Gemmatales bacterium]|nr:MAG: hypothetical protein KatS3mg105_4849 [Gemmatales bacterium]